MSGYDHVDTIDTIKIDGHEFDIVSRTVRDTPNVISHEIALTGGCIGDDDIVSLRYRDKVLRWNERDQCYQGGIESVRELDASDVVDMLPIDHEKLVHGLTLKKIKALYKKQNNRELKLNESAASLADRLLSEARGPVVGSPRALRMEPPLDPPDEHDDPECPECGGPMKDVKTHGRSDKWEWHFRCKDTGCDGEIKGDKFP